jgi:hypothetical protein
MIDIRNTSVRVQILAVREESGETARAVAAAENARAELTEIARQHGASALLVCPAPDGFVEDGFNLVVAARFAEPLDEEESVMRELDLSLAISRALQVRAVTLDLDGRLGRFLDYIDPMLVSPYRDEIGPPSSPIRTA